MDITFPSIKGFTVAVGAGTQVENLSDTITPQQNDIAVVVLSADGALDPAAGNEGGINTGESYNNVSSPTGSGIPGRQVAWKRLGASETTVTVNRWDTVALGGTQAGIILILRGVDETTALDVTPPAEATGAADNPDPPAITPVTDGAAIVITGELDDDAVASGAGAPTNYTGTFLAQDTEVADDNATSFIAARVLATAAAEDPGAFTSTGTDQWAASTIAFRPAAEAGGIVSGAGTAAGTGTAAAVGASTTAATGAAAGAGAATADGASTNAGAGTAAGDGAASGVGAGTSAAAGASTGTGAASGTGAATNAAVATAAGAGAATGAGISTNAGAGTAAGTAAATAGGAVLGFLLPNAVLATTNLQDTNLASPPVLLSDIQDDPEAPDADWWTAVDAGANTEARLGLATPAGTLVDAQEFQVYVRKTDTGNPTVDIDLWENGVLVTSLISGVSITSAVGQLITVPWDASLLADASGVDAEIRIVGTAAA